MSTIKSGTHEWHLARQRAITATDAGDLCAPKGIGKAGLDAVQNIAAAWECSEPYITAETYAMRRGNELQPIVEGLILDAFTDYERIDLDFKYLNDDVNSFVASSFDLVVKNKEGRKYHFEIKCPEKPANHRAFLKMKSPADLKAINRDYFFQCIHELKVGEFDGCFFVSYHPNFQPDRQLTILTINPDEIKEDIALWEQRISEAVELLKKEMYE